MQVRVLAVAGRKYAMEREDGTVAALRMRLRVVRRVVVRTNGREGTEIKREVETRSS